MSAQISGTNPYDFLAETKKPKKIFNFGGNKRERIIIAVFGATLLIVLIGIVGAILGNSGKKAGQDLIEVAQAQTEIIRVAGIGTSKARGTDAQNLARTTSSTIQTDNTNTLALLSKANIKTNAKELALTRNAKTDLLLTQAGETNQFDAVFTAELNKLLTAYQKTLQKAYGDASAKLTLNVLTEQFRHTEVLLAPSKTE